MQQYYTLEEAAQKLNMSVDELREMAKKKQIRAFQDRGNWRFRAQEIDEKARQLGVNSDPEVQLGDATKSPRPTKKPHESDAVDLGKKGPKSGSDSDVRLVAEQPGGKVDSDVRLNSPSPKKGADSGVRLDQESDSDVKLVGDGGSASDSDIRLHELPPPPKRKGDAAVITEEIDLDAEEARAKQAPPKSKPTKPRVPTQVKDDLPILPTSSPYELSEPDIGLQPEKKGEKTTNDSSSEHELVAFDEAKARGGDLGSGEIPLLSDDSDAIGLGDLPPPNAGNSGIKLDDPADSGISLESGSDELEFELSLDAGNTPKPQKGQAPAPAPAPSAQEDSSSEFELSLDDAPSDTSDSEFELSLDEDASSGDNDVNLEKIDNSDSEFELTLDEEGGLGVEEGGGKDIFEETNFDLPPLDDESQSEAVALEEPSDTDLEDSDFDLSMEEGGAESGSQVVTLDDDEEADDAAATVAKARKGAATAKKPTKAKKAPVEEEPSLDDAMADWDPKAKRMSGPAKEEEEEDEKDTGPPPPPDWGPLPAVLLFPTVIVMFFVGLMGFELVQGMWGYHRSTRVGRPIIDTVARMFDDKIPKE